MIQIKSSLAALIALATVLLCGGASASVAINGIDVNSALLYTLSNIQVDVNVITDVDANVIVQLYDNNSFVDENSLRVLFDGNVRIYKVSFVTQFSEGTHVLDANLLDVNQHALDFFSVTIDVLRNPTDIDENISWDLLQQYVLPIARSLSECLVERADLNILFTQSQSTMKALENDVGIANLAKQAAEDRLAANEVELTSCSTARSTCDADKTTTESKLLNSQAKCDNEKSALKDESDDTCDEQLLLKEQLITKERETSFEASTFALTMEQTAFGFGLMALAMVVVFAYLAFTKRIKINKVG